MPVDTQQRQRFVQYKSRVTLQYMQSLAKAHNINNFITLVRVRHEAYINCSAWWVLRITYTTQVLKQLLTEDTMVFCNEVQHY